MSKALTLSLGKRSVAAFLAMATTLWLVQAAFMALPARALTMDELMAEIVKLTAELNALKGTSTSTGYTFATTMKRGSRGAEVVELQKVLNANGYSVGTADGIFGLKTHNAVKAWQASAGLGADGVVGAKSRAKLNAISSTTTPPSTTTTPPSTTTTTPTTTPVAGGITVSVASDTPAAGTVVADTASGDGAQALAHMVHVKFQTPAGTSAKVTTLKLKRSGISADADLSNVYLYDGSTRVAESPIVSSTYFTFSNSAGLFTVSGDKTIMVFADIANGTTSGKTVSLGVNAASDVLTDATTVNGTFPIMGNTMTTATVSDLGKITIAHVSDPGTTIDAGLTDTKLWEFSLTAADQKIKVSSLRLTAIGTIDASALTNLKLHDGTAQIGTTAAALGSDKSVTFTFSPAYEMSAGLVRNIQLRGNIVGGTGRNFYFQFANGSDIQAMDANYGVAIKPDQADTYTLDKATNTTEISAGSLTVTRRADSPSGSIAKDALGKTLAKLDFKAVGENIKVTTLTVQTTTNAGLGTAGVDNGKILLDGAQIGTTTDLATNGTTATDTVFNFGSSFIVNAGQTRVLEIVGDVKKGNGTAMAANDTIQTDLKVGSSNFLRMVTGTTGNTAATTANNLTVTAAALTASKNPSVSNMTVVKGATGVTIGSWLITAGSAEGMNVSSIAFEDQTDGAETWGDAFNNLELYNGSTKLGQTIDSPTATGNVVVQTFNLSTALNIPAGQSKQVDLKANVLSGATWTADELDLTSLTGTGVVTSQSVTDATNAVGQTVTVASNGTLTVSVDASPTNPDSKYLVMGDIDQTVGAWKFDANNAEELRVYRVVLKEVGSSDTPGNVKNIKLFVGGVQVGGTLPAMTDSTSNTAVFEDATNGLFTVPKNGNVSLIAKADVTPFDNAAVDADGKKVQFRISNVVTQTSTSDISAKGVTSQAFATGAAGADFTGNVMTTVRTKPTFALDSSTSTTLVPGTVEVIRFTIAAHANNDVVFTSGTTNLRFTINQNGGTVTARAVDLYDASTDTTVATQLSYDLTTSGGVLDFTTFGATIPKSTTKTFYVKANLVDYATAGESFQLTIQNAAADMSFGDAQATGADIEEASYTGIGLPLSGKIIVKP